VNGSTSFQKDGVMTNFACGLPQVLAACYAVDWQLQVGSWA